MDAAGEIDGMDPMDDDNDDDDDHSDASDDALNPSLYENNDDQYEDQTPPESEEKEGENEKEKEKGSEHQQLAVGTGEKKKAAAAGGGGGESEGGDAHDPQLHGAFQRGGHGLGGLVQPALAVFIPPRQRRCISIYGNHTRLILTSLPLVTDTPSGHRSLVY